MFTTALQTAKAAAQEMEAQGLPETLINAVVGQFLAGVLTTEFLFEGQANTMAKLTAALDARIH